MENLDRYIKKSPKYVPRMSVPKQNEFLDVKRPYQTELSVKYHAYAPNDSGNYFMRDIVIIRNRSKFQ